MPKNLARTQEQGLQITLTSQVVVYTPAERAEKFSLIVSPLPYSVVAIGAVYGHWTMAVER
jgi:hypothetical protein